MPCHMQCGQWYNTPTRDYNISTCGGGEPYLTCGHPARLKQLNRAAIANWC